MTKKANTNDSYINLICNASSLRELLKLAQENDIIKNDSFRALLDMTCKMKLREEHNHAITQGKDGRWRTYFSDPNNRNKRIDVRAKTEDALYDKLLHLYKEASNLEKMKMQTLYELWIEKRDADAKDDSEKNTVTRHKQRYAKYYEGSALFNMAVVDVNRHHLQDFCNQLISKHNLKSKEFTNAKTILRGMFEYAVNADIISSNPIEQLKTTARFRPDQKKSGKSQVYNTDEQASLFEWLDERYDKKPDAGILAVKLNFSLGLRVGEIVALRWSDLVNGNHLHVWKEEIRNQSKRGDSMYSIAEYTKTNNDRLMPLVPSAVELLNQASRIAPPADCNDFIFTRAGKRVTARQFNYILEKYAKVKDVETKSSHKIRKTYASKLNAYGMPLDAIRELLGHSNLSTTLSYIYNPLTDEETFDILKKAL